MALPGLPMELGLYKLVDRTPVPVEDAMEWGEWMDKGDCDVADFRIEGPKGTIRVSTVFLGIDHSLGFDGTPLLFESMVFGWCNEYKHRYSTYEEAEAGHLKLVDYIVHALHHPLPLNE